MNHEYKFNKIGVNTPQKQNMPSDSPYREYIPQNKTQFSHHYSKIQEIFNIPDRSNYNKNNDLNGNFNTNLQTIPFFSPKIQSSFFYTSPSNNTISSKSVRFTPHNNQIEPKSTEIASPIKNFDNIKMPSSNYFRSPTLNKSSSFVGSFEKNTHFDLDDLVQSTLTRSRNVREEKYYENSNFKDARRESGSSYRAKSQTNYNLNIKTEFEDEDISNNKYSLHYNSEVKRGGELERSQSLKNLSRHQHSQSEIKFTKQLIDEKIYSPLSNISDKYREQQKPYYSMTKSMYSPSSNFESGIYETRKYENYFNNGRQTFHDLESKNYNEKYVLSRFNQKNSIPERVSVSSVSSSQRSPEKKDFSKNNPESYRSSQKNSHNDENFQSKSFIENKNNSERNKDSDEIRHYRTKVDSNTFITVENGYDNHFKPISNVHHIENFNHTKYTPHTNTSKINNEIKVDVNDYNRNSSNSKTHMSDRNIYKEPTPEKYREEKSGNRKLFFDEYNTKFNNNEVEKNELYNSSHINSSPVKPLQYNFDVKYTSFESNSNNKISSHTDKLKIDDFKDINLDYTDYHPENYTTEKYDFEKIILKKDSNKKIEFQNSILSQSNSNKSNEKREGILPHEQAELNLHISVIIPKIDQITQTDQINENLLQDISKKTIQEPTSLIKTEQKITLNTEIHDKNKEILAESKERLPNTSKINENRVINEKSYFYGESLILQSDCSNIIYEGEINNEGKKEGFGVLKNNEDIIYQGGWKNNQFHGDGIENNASQTTKKNQKTQINHEKISLHSMPWTKYEGSYKNGVRDGFAKITFIDESSFLGTLKHGVIDGLGIFMYANGEEVSGIWKGGIYQLSI